MTKKETVLQENGVKNLKQLETLYKVSQILVTGARQQQALADVLDTLDAELDLNRGTITILSPDGNEIRVEAAHNLSEEQSRRITYQIGEGVTGKVMQTGKPIIIPKVSQEPLFLNRFERWNTTKQELSFICVPISIGDNVIGTISVDKPFEETTGLHDGVATLSLVASMIDTDLRTRREAAIERKTLEDENIRLRHELEYRFRPEHITGTSHAIA